MGKQSTALRGRSSLEIAQSEAPIWKDTHPLYPIFPLFLKLAKLIVWSGPQWIFRVISMLLFISLLLPAFLQVGWYYVFSPDIIRNVIYGPNPRNLLDIYLPTDQKTKNKRPVLVFLSGGVWLIGYKGWGAFMGKILASYGILVVQPDYRNFPQGSIPNMLEDVNRALAWISKNIESYGGDKEEIYLVGQSAGAHLGAMAILLKTLKEGRKEQEREREAEREREKGEREERGKKGEKGQEGGGKEGAEDDDLLLSFSSSSPSSSSSEDELAEKPSEHLGDLESVIQKMRARGKRNSLVNPISSVIEELADNPDQWELSSIRSFIGIAGPYDIISVEGLFNRRGLPKRLLHSIFGGRKKLRQFSPSLLIEDHLQELSLPPFSSRLPPIVLLHGAADRCVPYSISLDFNAALGKIGAQSFVKLYSGKTHTDVIIEDLIYPQSGLSDDLMFDVINYVTKKLRLQKGESVEKALPKTTNHECFFGSNEEKFKGRNKHPVLLPWFLVEMAKFVNPF